jgi:tRNA pseudouridine55 synthase
VTIHALELIACARPDVTFRVTCSKGTYVRTLAEDIGEVLGCGAHLIALRRTGVGALTLEHAVTLDALSDAAQGELDCWLQPVDALLSTFPAVHLDDEATRRFLHGQRLRLADLSISDEISRATSSETSSETNGTVSSEAPRVRVYAATAGRLLGVARAGDGVLAPERLIVTAAPTS